MKRSTPLKRSAFKPQATVKPKECDFCGEDFFPARPMQVVCSPACASRKVRRQKKDEAAATRAAKEAAKGVQVLKVEAQEAVNAWVRLRDAGKGCFVCGAPLQLGGLGGGFDAGHIRSRSQADHLRYDERNVHGQCKPCNAPGSTKDHVMREAAARLLGQEVADELYADNRVHKWQRDELRQIRDTYRAKARQLKKERAWNA